MRKQKQLKEKKSNQMELEVNTSNIKSTDFSWDKNNLSTKKPRNISNQKSTEAIRCNQK